MSEMTFNLSFYSLKDDHRQLNINVCGRICLNRARMKIYSHTHKRKSQVEYQIPTNCDNTCLTCEKRCKSDKELKRNIKTNRNYVATVSHKTKSLEYPICSNDFKNHVSLNSHIVHGTVSHVFLQNDIMQYP